MKLMRLFLLSFLLISTFNVHAETAPLITLRALSVDFDDTLMFTNSKVFIYNKVNGQEKVLTTQEFAEIRDQLGKPGPYFNFEVHLSSERGSHRQFQDQPGKNQVLEAIRSTLREHTETEWQGPAWDIAVRALDDAESANWFSIVTARGHEPANVNEGLRFLRDQGYFHYLPHTEHIFTVSSPMWRKKGLPTELGKVLALTKMLDKLQREVMRRHKLGENIRGELVFIDDDRKNFENAALGLSQLRSRWPDVEIYVSFVGIHQLDLRPVSLKIESIDPRHLRCSDFIYLGE